MNRAITVIMALCMGATAFAGEEFRKFTSQDGREMRAKIVESGSPDKVTIQHENGTFYRDLNPEIFSFQDQRYIREWREKQRKSLDEADLSSDSRIEVRVYRGRDDDLNKYGNVDDRDVRYEPSVVIVNKELEKSYTGIQGTVVYVGQSVFDRKEFKILNRQEFTMDAPRKKETEWKGDPFQNLYDDDASNGHAFGYKYAGYLLVLKNRAGEVVFTKGSKGDWENAPQSLMQASLRSSYAKNFRRVINAQAR
ncbi:MAG: hypothetical protein AAFX93_14465 [Verrucomicrobiota bacterium]